MSNTNTERDNSPRPLETQNSETPKSLAELRKQDWILHEACHAPKFLALASTVSSQLEHGILIKLRVEFSTSYRVLGRVNVDTSVSVIAGWVACPEYGCNKVYTTDIDDGLYEMRLGLCRKAHEASLISRVAAGDFDEDFNVSAKANYEHINRTTVKRRKLSGNMEKHHIKEHSDNPNDARKAAMAKRSIQYTQAEKNEQKMAQNDAFVKLGLAFNKMRQENRAPLIALFEHMEFLKSTKMNMSYNDLFFSPQEATIALQMNIDKIMIETNALISNPNTRISATCDPWSANMSPHCYLDYNLRILVLDAETPTAMFRTRLLGMKTLKQGRKNNHTALHMQSVVLSILRQYPALESYIMGEASKKKDYDRKERDKVNVKGHKTLFEQDRYAIHVSNDNNAAMRILAEATNIRFSNCVEHATFNGLTEAFNELTDEDPFMESQFETDQTICKEVHWSFDRIGSYNTIPRKWNARTKMTAKMCENKSRIIELIEQKSTLDDDKNPFSECEKIDWQFKESLRDYLNDYTTAHTRAQSRYALAGEALFVALRVQSYAENDYGNLKVNSLADRVRGKMISKVYSDCLSQRQIVGFFLFPVAEIHLFSSKYFDDDGDRKFYSKQISEYLLHDAAFDMDWEIEHLLDEEVETSEAVYLLAQQAGLDVSISKRKTTEIGSTSNNNPRNKKKKYVLDPDTTTGKLYGHWACFHTRIADPSTYLGKKALPLSFTEPESVKNWSFKVIQFWKKFQLGPTLTEEDILLRDFALELLQEMPTSVLSETFWSEAGNFDDPNLGEENFEHRMMIKCNR